MDGEVDRVLMKREKGLNYEVNGSVKQVFTEQKQVVGMMRETVEEQRSSLLEKGEVVMSTEDVLKTTKTIMDQWLLEKKEGVEEITDDKDVMSDKSEDDRVINNDNNIMAGKTRKSFEHLVEYEKAVKKFLTHTTLCSKCVDDIKRDVPAAAAAPSKYTISILLVMIAFIVRYVKLFIYSSARYIIMDGNDLGKKVAGEIMATTAVEQYQLDGGEGTEEDVLPSNGITSHVRQIEVTNGHHLNKLSEETTNGKNEMLQETGEVLFEEEIVDELEIEKVKPKLDTHSTHCPNCNAEVTKVILCRKVLVFNDPPVTSPVVVEQQPDPKDSIVDTTPLQPDPVHILPGQVQTAKYILGTPSIEIDASLNADGDGHITLDLGTSTEFADTGRLRLGYEGVFAEILKSIVYGGLMELIASLSVVASAAASDAAPLSIISLALASLIGGVLVITHNLWELRDDCHKESTAEVTNSEATNKYKELLGRMEYFPLHAFFAILSFLVSGMVPPIAYGYSFHETNDKDYTLVVVSVASLLCVSLLALSKAYTNKCRVLGYFKTVAYYIITAVSVSGVSYVIGNLVTRLMEEYGLFDTSSGGGVSLLPHATIPSLASF